MANVPRELPGFYFDPKKKKYFPLTQEKKTQFKKQKLDTKSENQNEKYWSSYIKNSLKLIKDIQNFKSADLDDKIYGIGNLISLRKNGSRIFNELNIRAIDMTHDGYENESILMFSTNKGDKYWNILTDGRIIKYVRDRYQDRWDIRTSCYGLTDIENFTFNPRFDKLELLNFNISGNNIKIHCKMKQKRTSDNNTSRGDHNDNTHVFRSFSIPRHNDLQSVDLKCYVRLDEKEYEKIYDSVATHHGPIITHKKKIVIMNWDYPNKKTVIKVAKTSEITSLAIYEEDNLCHNILCGTRNGYIYNIPVSSTYQSMKPILISQRCYRNLLGIVSVVSLTTLPDNKLLVSAIKDGTDSQYLFIVDILELDSDDDFTTAIPTVLITKFKNATKKTELLSVSDDGKYICYGKGNDFDVFSLEYSTFDHKKNICSCRPYASFKDFSKNYPHNDLSGFKLSNISFANGKQLYDSDLIDNIERFSDLKLERRIEDSYGNICTDSRKLPVLTMSFTATSNRRTDYRTPVNKLVSSYVL